MPRVSFHVGKAEADFKRKNGEFIDVGLRVSLRWQLVKRKSGDLTSSYVLDFGILKD
jgi:hypothetical protein